MSANFSIITVTYNAAGTLERTIRSVMEQNYPHIEYIVIDGGSSDSTRAIIEKYKARIRITVSEKDSGIYDAMNKGLTSATGDYVWFINAGDTIYSPDTITEIASQLKNLPGLPDIVYGETVIVNNKQEYLYIRRLKAPEKLSWHSFRDGMLISHQAFIVKRSIATAYDLHYRFSADYDWCIRCMKQARLICNTHLILANYLDEGTTTRNLKASLKERFNIMCKYYGRIPTYLRHIKFALRFGLAKLTGKN
ncbi:MAG: glycosyltransferase [Prevotellaceae bacterium]|jgi:glycosyltransferase involved in cell wall biosynthesis|nr:glycosyltransferase [Prevotellaceae bacterium]